jgi:ribosomal protein S18 acetylase RimI-like enzyme
MEIRLATLADLDAATALFDQYRGFYGQASDPEAAKRFLAERLQNQDSVIFLAAQPSEPQAAGFTQLYPSFSSVSMQRIWILNDLFVAPAYRRQGLASQLMATAEQYARDTGAVRVALSTQITNSTAQALYEARGYQRDQTFYDYALALLE